MSSLNISWRIFEEIKIRNNLIQNTVGEYPPKLKRALSTTAQSASKFKTEKLY